MTYAIGSALRALSSHLNLLLPTIGPRHRRDRARDLERLAVCVGERFREGGGVLRRPLAERSGSGVGTLLPIGALVVDFALTIAISIAAAVSAVIALRSRARRRRGSPGISCSWRWSRR